MKVLRQPKRTNKAYTGSYPERPLLDIGKYTMVLQKITFDEKEVFYQGTSKGIKPHIKFHFLSADKRIDGSYKYNKELVSSLADRSNFRQVMKDILLFANGGDWGDLEEDDALLANFLKALYGNLFVVSIKQWKKEDKTYNSVDTFYPAPNQTWPNLESLKGLPMPNFDERQDKVDKIDEVVKIAVGDSDEIPF
jgi:hypothetical protein